MQRDSSSFTSPLGNLASRVEANFSALFIRSRLFLIDVEVFAHKTSSKITTVPFKNHRATQKRLILLIANISPATRLLWTF